MHFEFYTNSIWCLINHPLKQSTVCVRERERERERWEMLALEPIHRLWLLAGGMEGAWTEEKKGMGRVFWEEVAGEGAGLHPGRCSQLKTYRSCMKGLRDGVGETEEQQGVACSLAEVWCPPNSFNVRQIWEDGSLLSISAAGQGLRGHWKEERRKRGKEEYTRLLTL